MQWFKKNWLWLVVNIIAVVPLVIMLNSFSFDFSNGIVPTVTIEQSAAPPENVSSGDSLAVTDSQDVSTDTQVQDSQEVSDGATFEPRPHSALSGLIHVSGEWAMRLLVLSLSCTPLYILFNWRQVLSLKKATGLYAFMYATLHFLFFAAERGWLAMFNEFNFVMGLISVLIMLPLALTSTEWAMKRMSKNWKLLHRAAYAAGVFAVLHVALLGEGSAILYVVLLTIGFALRIPKVRKAISNWWSSHKRHPLNPLAAKG
ncbi:MAG: ferric reductase-like transmembrane domain-containing protein [Anaerolineae bacterium]|nr:ferric reductase-like transmembrane domain-containing protein [Anaerolineae bacterium]